MAQLDARLILAQNAPAAPDLPGMQQQALITGEMQARAQDRVTKAKEDIEARKASENFRKLLSQSMFEDDDGNLNYDPNFLMQATGGSMPPEAWTLIDKANGATKAFKAAQNDALKTSAMNIEATGFNEGFFVSELDRLERIGVLRGRHLRTIREEIDKDPVNGMKAVLRRWNPPPPPKVGDPYTLGTNDIRFGGDNKVVARGNPPAPPAGTAPAPYTLSPGQVRFGADNQRVAGVAPRPTGGAGGAVSPAQAQAQAATVDAIVKTPALFNTLTDSRRQELIPELQAKNFDFAKALQAKVGGTGAGGPNPTLAIVVDKLEGLSKKINTESGLSAIVSGTARSAAAKAQMDNDVSLYESLVLGMVPIVARAMGHTGVLTQQDVDSVRAMFPIARDNKALAESKLSAIRDVIGANKPAPAGSGSDKKTLYFNGAAFDVTKNDKGEWVSASGGVYDDAGKRIR